MEKLFSVNIFNKQGYHAAETVLRGKNATFRHNHDFYEIFIMRDGEMSHLLNQDINIVTKDDLCLIRPEDTHCFRKQNCNRAYFLNLAFSKELYRQGKTIWEEKFKGNAAELQNQAHLNENIAQAIGFKILYLMKHMSCTGGLATEDLVLSVLVDSLLCLQNERSGQEPIPRWLERACEQMRDRENYMLGMERFVKLSNRSQEHLTRMMKKYYHMTPSAYINHIRLEYAAFLLRTTEESVLSVMLECGFNNVSYFNLRFREKYGQSPTQYRRFNQLTVVL